MPARSTHFRDPQNCRTTRRWSTTVGLFVATLTVLLASVLSAPLARADAASRAPLTLGAAGAFSVLAQAAVTITASSIQGQVGAEAAITDGADTRYGSTRHAANDLATQAAVTAATAAYGDGMSRTATGTLSSGELGGQTIHPGIYHSVAAYTMATPVTFDAGGNSDAVFILQGDAALNTTAGTTMNLIDGAKASQIFWVIRAAATLGASSTFYGTILSNAAITVGATSRVDGRALSVGAAVTLVSDTFGPIDQSYGVVIDGGATNTTQSLTPTISGTSNAPPGSSLTVTVGGQTLDTTLGTGGGWTVTTGPLPLGSVNVVATVTDSAGNTGTATQVLTVTAPPAGTAPTIAIKGGASSSTQSSTPTISGTSNAPPGSSIVVTIDGQTLTTTVATGGSWSVTAGAVVAGTYWVTAKVTDAAGTGWASQLLTVAAAPIATAPTILIRGGLRATTTNWTPTISGMAKALAGAQIVVTIDGQTLTTRVAPDAGWSVQAATLQPHAMVATLQRHTMVARSSSRLVQAAPRALAVYPVTATVTDLAGRAQAVQTLTIMALGSIVPTAPVSTVIVPTGVRPGAIVPAARPAGTVGRGAVGPVVDPPAAHTGELPYTGFDLHLASYGLLALLLGSLLLALGGRGSRTLRRAGLRTGPRTGMRTAEPPASAALTTTPLAAPSATPRATPRATLSGAPRAARRVRFVGPPGQARSCGQRDRGGAGGVDVPASSGFPACSGVGRPGATRRVAAGPQARRRLIAGCRA